MKCPFCFEEDLKTKKCSNEALNFYCQSCKSSGYCRKGYVERFLAELEMVFPKIHDGMFDTNAKEFDPGSGMYGKFQCPFCHTRCDTKLATQKKDKNRIYLYCDNCRGTAFTNKGYWKFFL